MKIIKEIFIQINITFWVFGFWKGKIVREQSVYKNHDFGHRAKLLDFYRSRTDSPNERINDITSHHTDKPHQHLLPTYFTDDIIHNYSHWDHKSFINEFIIKYLSEITPMSKMSLN